MSELQYNEIYLLKKKGTFSCDRLYVPRLVREKKINNYFLFNDDQLILIFLDDQLLKLFY